MDHDTGLLFATMWETDTAPSSETMLGSSDENSVSAVWVGEVDRSGLALTVLFSEFPGVLAMPVSLP